MTVTERAPHSYQHAGGGRWVCGICNAFIVNVDCRVNREWMLDSDRSQPADAFAAEESRSQRPSPKDAE